MIVKQPHLWWDDRIYDYSLKALTDEVIAIKRANGGQRTPTLIEGWGVALIINEFNDDDEDKDDEG